MPRQIPVRKDGQELLGWLVVILEPESAPQVQVPLHAIISLGGENREEHCPHPSVSGAVQPDSFQEGVEGFQVIDQDDQGERVQGSGFCRLFLDQHRCVRCLIISGVDLVFVKNNLTGPDPQEQEQAKTHKKNHQQQF